MKNVKVFPSLSSWVTPRSDETQLTDENCKIILNDKIDQIHKVAVDAATAQVYIATKKDPDNNLIGPQYETTFSNLSTTSDGKSRLIELDITPFVVEYAKWQTLPSHHYGSGIASMNYKENTWYYEHNGNEIILLNDTNSEWFKTYSQTWRLLHSVVNYYVEHGGLWYINEKNNTIDEVLSADAFQIKGTKVPTNLRFRIYYTPLGESVALTTPKTEPQEHQFTIPFAQQQPIVSSQAMGKNMQAMANRTGVPVRIVKRKIDKLKDLRKVGTIWRETDENGNRTGNIYRLTSQRIEVVGGYAIITERWSKNWMMQSEFVGINREFRSWKIPADIVQRNLHYQDYCYITSDADFEVKDSTDLTDIAKKYVLSSLKGGAVGISECASMWFYNRDKQGDVGVVLSCSAMGFGNSLVFSGKTKDNLSAGTQRVKSDDNDDDYQYCKDVYYCNEDGTMKKLFVQIASKIDDSSSDKALNSYPEVSALMNTPSGVTVFKDDTKPFIVLKDPAEQLNFTYQLHLVTHDPDLVIGAAWAANCPLVASRSEDVNLLYWDLSQPLPKGMQTMSKSWGKQRTSSPVSINTDGSGMFTIQPMSCITDENHNVIVAYNGDKPRTFYMKYTHDYDKLQQEYYRLHSAGYRDATVEIK